MDLLHPRDGNAMGRYLQRYVYDAVGNFLEMIHRGSDPSHPGWTRAYTYAEPSLLEPGKASNRLTGTQAGDGPVETYQHDEHGNLTRMPHLPVMRWDFRDRLRATSRQVVGPAGVPDVTWYLYAAAGERVRKVTDRAVIISAVHDNDSFELRRMKAEQKLGPPGWLPPILLTRVSRLPPGLADAVQALAPRYKRVRSPGGADRFANHCECGTLLGDDEVHGPGGAFDVGMYQEMWTRGIERCGVVRPRSECPGHRRRVRAARGLRAGLRAYVAGPCGCIRPRHL